MRRRRTTPHENEFSEDTVGELGILLSAFAPPRLWARSIELHAHDERGDAGCGQFANGVPLGITQADKSSTIQFRCRVVSQQSHGLPLTCLIASINDSHSISKIFTDIR
jgi:hypothetical protein